MATPRSGKQHIDAASLPATHTRLRIEASDVAPIMRALETAQPVYDTVDLTKSAQRVAEFIAQHAGGDPYVPLFPMPSNGATGVTMPLLCDMWQFTYPDGQVHGHITMHRPNSTMNFICVTPVSLPNRVLFGTTSRRSAQQAPYTLDNHDALATYLFERNNDVIRNRVIATPVEVYRFATVHGNGELTSIGARIPSPGTDLHYDAGPGFLQSSFTLHRREWVQA